MDTITSDSAPAPAPASAVSIGGHSYAKDFFLWLGFIITFYGSVTSIITLFFQYIDRTFPDAVNRFGAYNSFDDPYSSAIRFAIATLIVFSPTAAVIMRIIRKDLVEYPEKARSGIRRFAIIATIFISSITALIDVITLIYGFLDGSLTGQTELKIGVVLLISIGVFLHFLADYKGYWIRNRQRANMVGIGAVALCLATIAAGFVIIGSPMQARLLRFDYQRTTDMESIMNQVQEYTSTHGVIPTKLSDLSEVSYGFMVPLDPQTNAPYEYRAVNTSTYQICGIFNKAAIIPSYVQKPEIGSSPLISQHGAGHECFLQGIELTKKSPNIPSPIVR